MTSTDDDGDDDAMGRTKRGSKRVTLKVGEQAQPSPAVRVRACELTAVYVHSAVQCDGGTPHRRTERIGRRARARASDPDAQRSESDCAGTAVPPTTTTVTAQSASATEGGPGKHTS